MPNFLKAAPPRNRESGPRLRASHITHSKLSWPHPIPNCYPHWRRDPRRGVAARLGRAHCSRAVRVEICVPVSAFARGPWLLHFWADLAPKGCSIR